MENNPLQHIALKGTCFLLVVLLEGRLRFRRAERETTAIAPCFICFDEQENPELLSHRNARYFAVYFHPAFLNVNMTFAAVRAEEYADFARNHDLFLLRPFWMVRLWCLRRRA